MIAPIAGSALLAVVFLVAPAPAAAGFAARPSDFNGDGYADLAIGARREALGSKTRAGVVDVLYGTSIGLSATGAQAWHQDQPGVKGVSRKNELLGSALASGDFDADGYADLAVGVPNDKDTDTRHAGAVNVLYGSTQGLTAAGDQLWTLENLPGQPNGGEHLGQALASGDFDEDGFWDLAIGVPDEAVDDVPSAGVVVLLRGGPAGLSNDGAVRITRASVGGSDDVSARFGSRLASGNLDGDGSADLAVGAPFQGGGDVGVLYGHPDGLGLGAHQLWSQDSDGVLGEAGPSDLFGWSLVVGDFDGDGIGDLAVGAMGDEVETCGDSGCSGGAVAILYGTSAGLSAAGNQLWTQDSPDVPGVAGDESQFGRSVAAGDFDGDGADDLAIGAPPDEDDTGSVTVLEGGDTGLTASGAERWTQDTPGVPGTADNGAFFGWSLGSHDYGHSARADLAIGAIGREEVIVLYGQVTGLQAEDAQRWSQASPGVPGTQESGDEFGWTFSP